MNNDVIIKKSAIETDQLEDVNQLTDALVCADNAFNPTNIKYSRIDYAFKNYLEISNGWYVNDNHYGIITFKLPDGLKPHDIQSLSFIDSKATKTSWGSSASYHGKNINEVIPKNRNFVDYSSNSQACSFGDILYKDEMFELLNIKDTWSSSVIISKQQVWFNWFLNESNYFIQIAYSQYAETWGSRVGGSMWLNFGSGLTINLHNG